MALLRYEYVSLAVIVDWLDLCRARDLNALLEIYDEQATFVCSCGRIASEISQVR